MAYKASRLAQLAAVKEQELGPGPERVIWQITRACDLCCIPCRTMVMDQPAHGQLTLDQGLTLVEQIRQTGQPNLVLTGGDPLKRTDLGMLVMYAHRLGLPVSLTLSGTPRTTPRTLGLLKAAGLESITFCVDGPDEPAHDRYRGTPGSYRWTVDGIQVAHGIGLPIHIETAVAPDNVAYLDDLAEHVGRLGAREWHVSFRPDNDEGLSVEEHAAAIQRLAALQGTVNFRVRITPAPYFVGSGHDLGCEVHWRPMELFISDTGDVDHFNSGRRLGNVTDETFAQLVERVRASAPATVALAGAGG